MLLALSSNQKLGLALVAGAFVAFALLSAIVLPRSNPDFPEKRLNLFVGVAVVFTVAMLAAVALLAKESEEETHVTETAPVETAVIETAPPETAPAETAVIETAPAETAPAETAVIETAPAETEATGTTAAETTAPTGDAAAGEAVFTSTCAGCHTLSDAGASGTVGPNLDDASPSYDKVVERVTNGKGGMPSFGGSLSETQIQDVAAYVSSVAGT